MSTVPSVHLLDAVGARPAVREQNFSPKRLSHSPPAAPPSRQMRKVTPGIVSWLRRSYLMIFQAGQGLVLQGIGDAVPCHHSV